MECFLKMLGYDTKAGTKWIPDYQALKSAKIPIIVGLSEQGNISNKMIVSLLEQKIPIKKLWFAGKHNCPMELPKEFISELIGYLQLIEMELLEEIKTNVERDVLT